MSLPCIDRKCPGTWEPESISQRPARFEMLSGRCELLSGRCELFSGRCEMLSGSQVPGFFLSMHGRLIKAILFKCQSDLFYYQTSAVRDDSWCPATGTAWKLLLSARLCAAVWSGVSDCDEAFNYWEPTHHLIYSQGMQTWEYDPK